MAQEATTEQVRQLAEATRRYLHNEIPQHQTPRITRNPDAWLQECVAILSETSIEMVSMMAKKPQEIAPFMRVFALVTNLAADSKKLLQQSGGGQPPIASTGSTGDNDDMERRIADLEVDMKDVRDRLVRVETKLDNAQQKLDGLPSKDFVTAKISSSSTKIILWVAALVGAAQLIPSIAVPLLRHFGIAP